ncbi:aspartic proteinase 39-like isoform X2 [Phoenix dactylifera]|uniref:Aspartic proteinase 39-like isoform X2 n=1 Tax=Phoenix dactylifera TaxID=42345 RepID=A0A8B8ZER9_PHODC|nr:aspartic proteinase 39-like isoform X2 [Phoenix dactylifera]
MGPRRRLLSLLFFFSFAPFARATGVFPVRHKYLHHKRPIADLRSHDVRRHGRILSAVDLPIGGVGLPTDTGLYFAEIGIGTPPKTYYVQVDTGSDILWVNCVTCTRCPKKSDLGIELTLYDPKGSHSGSLVSCNENFCTSTYGGEIEGCSPNNPCQYSVMYGDGSSTAGYFVTDVVEYNQVSGNHRTTPANASVSFGCGAQQSGDLGSSSEALDGILGFGQSNSSMISQLAAAGRVRKVFAHCLDTVKGGGIFALGNVVEPKVKTTPLIPNMPHYNVNLRAIEVAGAFLRLPTDLFENGDKKGTIIDSGTTLSYLPEAAYKPLLNADDVYCVGWQNGGMQSKDGKDMFLLGDLALSNKLVLYDLENQVIGWTEHNCSSSIQIKDDKTGAIFTVDAHNISSAHRLEVGMSILLLLIIMICYLSC